MDPLTRLLGPPPGGRGDRAGLHRAAPRPDGEGGREGQKHFFEGSGLRPISGGFERQL
jgi:hypothetical protein